MADCILKALQRSKPFYPEHFIGEACGRIFNLVMECLLEFSETQFSTLQPVELNVLQGYSVTIQIVQIVLYPYCSFPPI